MQALQPGVELPEVVHTVTQDDIQRYAEASRDFNPLHINEEFARATPFGGTIAHGLMSVAFLSDMMVQHAGPAWFHSGSLDIKFVAPVRSGDTVRAHGQIVATEPTGHPDGTRRVRCEVRCTTQTGTDVLVGEASYSEMAGRPFAESKGVAERFWAAAAEGRLEHQWCDHCQEGVFPPRILCPRCADTALQWRASAGVGTVYSYTVVRRPRDPYFRGKEPYVVALIDLEPGVRMMSNLVDVDVDQVHIGMPVRATFERMSDRIGLPLFRPKEDS